MKVIMIMQTSPALHSELIKYPFRLRSRGWHLRSPVPPPQPLRGSLSAALSSAPSPGPWQSARPQVICSLVTVTTVRWILACCFCAFLPLQPLPRPQQVCLSHASWVFLLVPSPCHYSSPGCCPLFPGPLQSSPDCSLCFHPYWLNTHSLHCDHAQLLTIYKVSCMSCQIFQRFLTTLSIKYKLLMRVYKVWHELMSAQPSNPISFTPPQWMLGPWHSIQELQRLRSFLPQGQLLQSRKHPSPWFLQLAPSLPSDFGSNVASSKWSFLIFFFLGRILFGYKLLKNDTIFNSFSVTSLAQSLNHRALSVHIWWTHPYGHIRHFPV